MNKKAYFLLFIFSTSYSSTTEIPSGESNSLLTKEIFINNFKNQLSWPISFLNYPWIHMALNNKNKQKVFDIITDKDKDSYNLDKYQNKFSENFMNNFTYQAGYPSYLLKYSLPPLPKYQDIVYPKPKPKILKSKSKRKHSSFDENISDFKNKKVTFTEDPHPKEVKTHYEYLKDPYD